MWHKHLFDERSVQLCGMDDLRSRQLCQQYAFRERRPSVHAMPCQYLQQFVERLYVHRMPRCFGGGDIVHAPGLR